MSSRIPTPTASEFEPISCDLFCEDSRTAPWTPPVGSDRNIQHSIQRLHWARLHLDACIPLLFNGVSIDNKEKKDAQGPLKPAIVAFIIVERVEVVICDPQVPPRLLDA